MWKELQAQLGVVVIVLGSAVGFLAALDWLLSAETKRWIQEGATTAWVWLSEQRETWPFIRKLQDKRAFTFFLTSGVVLLVALLMAMEIMMEDKHNVSPERIGMLIIIPLLGTIPGALIVYALRGRLRLVFTWISNAPSSIALFLRAFGGLAILLTSFGILLLAPPNEVLAFISNAGEQYQQDVVAVIAMIIYLTLGTFYFLILFSAIVLCLYVFVVCFSLVILKIMIEFTQRIAEYDKGPVMGTAAFLTLVGAFLKFFV
jgi:hypothetical protein